MVNGDGAVFHAHLHAARDGHLVGVDLRPHAIFDARHEDAFGVLDSEEALVAEHIDEVGEVFSSHERDHLVDDQVDIVLLMATILHRDAVCSKEVRLDGQGRVLLQATDDAEELQLTLGGQAVAALDLDGARTHTHHLVEALLGHDVEFVLRCRRRRLGRIEDASSPLGDLLVAEAADLVDKLQLTRVGVDEMCVRVAEGGHHHATFHIVDTMVLGEIFAAGVRIHRAIVGDFLAFDIEESVFDSSRFGHFGTAFQKSALFFDADEFLDVDDEHNH